MTKILDNIHLEEETRDLNVTNLNTLNKQYQNVREHRMRGHQVRSRAELTANWEKPSKFFLNLEKKNYLNKTISELLDENDSKVTQPENFLEMQYTFYQDLFSSKKTIPLNDSAFSSLLGNLPTLDEFTMLSLDDPFTIKELEDSIKRSKLNKSPGPDGYTNEFFKYFCEELKTWLFRCY